MESLKSIDNRIQTIRTLKNKVSDILENKKVITNKDFESLRKESSDLNIGYKPEKINFIGTIAIAIGYILGAQSILTITNNSTLGYIAIILIGFLAFFVMSKLMKSYYRSNLYIIIVSIVNEIKKLEKEKENISTVENS
ncbi:hypothetical protein CP985_03245 [Malaciobacter mytili LMG 24559]|uniref:Uncharacterized protein n=1 Tax=Malaciobacter mytili LMG 24559 TaxID=1032238 RepID=A0AAX2AI80_9BACT|nr:hypothetical protein [Malaciobacter mytili]AXH16375.1 putative membrane protein [Malaciobacter mytili LMG 24559]RXK16439.1 hypothetical protein CP985_03245 [Malaciobacter mytili LMG 24559]